MDNFILEKRMELLFDILQESLQLNNKEFSMLKFKLRDSINEAYLLGVQDGEVYNNK